MATVAGPASRQNHSYSNNLANTKQAQLATAYQQLQRELASDQIKVVGGYTLGKVIGEGTFGSVHIASHRPTGTRCAIKKIPKSATPQLTRELHHHRRLHHPHIVHLHEIIATETHIWLVSELCPGGELFDYLVERGRLLEGEARRLFGELCTAVGWLHSQGVVHRDLKLENVLLDGELRVKLGDLGFAREYTKGRLMETFCGTTGYASPEMLECKKYLGVETDIWSLGIILYTLLCGGLPFDDDDERVMKDLIIKGEYEEPEWLAEEPRSLIRGMLHKDPAQRLTMDGILTHPWFKNTIYDKINTVSNDGLSTSVPPSPIPDKTAFSESLTSIHRMVSASSATSSFPFSPRRSSSATQLAPPQEVPASPDAESAPSETSFDFSDGNPNKQTNSGDTSPTTAENEDEPEVKRNNSDGSVDISLSLLHTNSSQSTIRESSGMLRSRVKRLSLEAKDDSDLEGSTSSSRADKRLSASSLPMIDEHSLPLPVADHSRTPLRTKRRSLTSQLGLERRMSHHSVSSQCQVYPPEDYLALLHAERPPLFSTPSEKLLLHRLSDLGFDTGQLIHSVTNDACDCVAAMWWILRLKQVERGETDDAVQARQVASQQRRERAARRREKEKAERSDKAPPPHGTPVVTVGEDGVAQGSGHHLVPPPIAGRPRTPDTDMCASSTASTSSLYPSRSHEREISSTSTATILAPNATASEHSPSKAELRKGRSPSMNMLQRATSVLVGGARGYKEHHREVTPEPPDTDKGSKRGESPTKRAAAKMTKSESDPLLQSNPGGPSSVGGVTPAGPSPHPPDGGSPTRNPSVVSGPATSTSTADTAKGPKKDSLWTAFRHLFYEDKRRRKREEAQAAAKPSPVVPTRVANARGSHMSRTSLQSSSRRTSYDGASRPMYSHRSSSVNSRRSSIASTHVPDFTINMHDGLPPLQYGNGPYVNVNGLNRRRSARSQRSNDGSQTPTSDRDYGSRPGSSASRRGGSRRSSLRSPIGDSASARMRSAPASPLHDYHRRAASGSASSRVRHIKVMHEAKSLRPSSVASSVRSGCSSRNSSFDLTREFDSEDMGRDETASLRSLRRHLDERGLNLSGLPMSQYPSRGRSRGHSPLGRGRTPLGRGNPPLRDVFQKKATDDEWESEDDDGFAGGLGQAQASAAGKGPGPASFQTKWTREGGAPATNRYNTSISAGSSSGAGPGMGHSGMGNMGSMGSMGSMNGSRDRDSGNGMKRGSGSNDSSASSSGSSRARRGGLPPARNQAPVIEEEEEEEE